MKFEVGKSYIDTHKIRVATIKYIGNTHVTYDSRDIKSDKVVEYSCFLTDFGKAYTKEYRIPEKRYLYRFDHDSVDCSKLLVSTFPPSENIDYRLKFLGEIPDYLGNDV